MRTLLLFTLFFILATPALAGDYFSSSKRTQEYEEVSEESPKTRPELYSSNVSTPLTLMGDSLNGMGSFMVYLALAFAIFTTASVLLNTVSRRII